MSHGRIPAFLISVPTSTGALQIAPDNFGIFAVYNYTHLNKQILLLAASIMFTSIELGGLRG